MINLPKQRPSKRDLPTDIILNFTLSVIKKFSQISMFDRAFFNSILHKHQHMHLTFNSILV